MFNQKVTTWYKIVSSTKAFQMQEVTSEELYTPDARPLEYLDMGIFNDDSPYQLQYMIIYWNGNGKSVVNNIFANATLEDFERLVNSYPNFIPIVADKPNYCYRKSHQAGSYHNPHQYQCKNIYRMFLKTQEAFHYCQQLGYSKSFKKRDNIASLKKHSIYDYEYLLKTEHSSKCWKDQSKRRHQYKMA